MTSIGFKMGMTGRAVLAGGVMGMGFMSGAAQATVYNWTWQDDDGWSSSGQFDETAGLITSFSGTWDGVPIDSLSPQGTLGGNNNAFPLDLWGVTFSLTSAAPTGDTLINLFEAGGIVWGGNATPLSYGTFTATVAEVPEPGSALLLGTSVAGLLAGARRRRVKARAAT